MPNFHFNFRSGSSLLEDESGLECDSVEQAYLLAFEGAADMWRELLRQRQDPRSCGFIVTDADGRAMFELPFGEVLEACRPAPGETNSKAIKPVLEIILNARRAQRFSKELRHELRTARQILSESRALVALAESIAKEMAVPAPERSTSEKGEPWPVRPL